MPSLDKGIQCCTRNQDELVSVKFRKLKVLTDVCLNCLKSPKLKSVDLKDCVKVTFEGKIIIIFLIKILSVSVLIHTLYQY